MTQDRRGPIPPHRNPPDHAQDAGPGQPQSLPTRAFRPGPGFLIVLALGALVILLALSAAITTALGARGASSILGGIALIIVGLGLLAVLRVPARSLVVNAPRLRLERNRARAARARREQEARAVGRWWAWRRSTRPGPQARRGGSGTAGTAVTPGPHGPGGESTWPAPLAIPGTALVIPESTGRRELRTLDVVSGPLTTALATTRLGRAADEHLAGTTTGESLVRVGQLLLGALGFVLMALGLASVLGQVIA